jgi:putative alpha-1,2-mannosidase
MSSWYAFGKLGIYPNAAQDVYLIGSPAYLRSVLHLANGRNFVIETEGGGDGKPYIASATLNGKVYSRAWLTHEQIMRGGTLRFVMSAAPTQWGREDLPPSLSRMGVQAHP